MADDTIGVFAFGVNSISEILATAVSEEDANVFRKTRNAIYTIKHTASGKQYIGQTQQSVWRRLVAHLRDAAGKRRGYCSAIHAALAKYGVQAFTFRVLEVCETAEQLNAAEQVWIQMLSTVSPDGYNLKGGGEAPGTVSDQTRAKMSVSAKARPEEDRKASAEKRRGWHHTEDAKARIAAAVTGRKWTADARAKLSATAKADPKRRAQLDIARNLKGPMTDAQRERLRAAMNSAALLAVKRASKQSLKATEKERATRAIDKTPGVRSN